MAERPDLEYVLPILSRELVGHRVTAVRVKKPVVLRVAVPEGLEPAVVGRRVASITRRAHFAVFALDEGAAPTDLAIAPMLAGRFVVADVGTRAPGDLALALVFEDGRELRYRDDVQMGKVYVVRHDDTAAVPGLAHVGVDVMNKKTFTRAAFRALARERRDQAKVFLMDKTALDALGNAYADEALFAGGVHPKTFVRALDDAALDRLHDAIVTVLNEARRELAARRPATDVKLRDFLKVRNREGEPCPVCQTKIRRAGVHGHDAFFCPVCQPETRRSGIVDWRNLKPPG